MSYLSSTIREELLAKLESKQTLLTAAEAQLAELLESPIEEYRFNSGDGGNQWARRRSIRQAKELVDELEREIDNIIRRLRGNGLTSIVQRRR